MLGQATPRPLAIFEYFLNQIFSQTYKKSNIMLVELYRIKIVEPIRTFEKQNCKKFKSRGILQHGLNWLKANLTKLKK